MIFSTTRIFLQRYFISRRFYIKGKLNKLFLHSYWGKNSQQLLWNGCNKKLGRCLEKSFAWLRLMLEELLYMLFVSDRELSWNFSSLAGYLCWTDMTRTSWDCFSCTRCGLSSPQIPAALHAQTQEQESCGLSHSCFFFLWMNIGDEAESCSKDRRNQGEGWIKLSRSF